jgi:hypothetical protein
MALTAHFKLNTKKIMLSRKRITHTISRQEAEQEAAQLNRERTFGNTFAKKGIGNRIVIKRSLLSETSPLTLHPLARLLTTVPCPVGYISYDDEMLTVRRMDALDDIMTSGLTIDHASQEIEEIQPAILDCEPKPD